MAVELPDGRTESNEVLEALRLRAVAAREKGYPVVDIAAILGVREETVWRWCVKYEQGGQQALPGDRTGRPVGSGRHLDSHQEAAIQRLIDEKTPQELGIPSALWTRAAVRELIKQQAGQDMPIRTVGEYLNRWGYTPQKPVKKSYKQDPKEVAEWLDTKYYPGMKVAQILQYRRMKTKLRDGTWSWQSSCPTLATCPMKPFRFCACVPCGASN